MGETVDKSVTEIKWCDHVHVAVDVLKSPVPTALISSPLTYMIIEDGTVKLLCGTCLRTALAYRLDMRAVH